MTTSEPIVNGSGVGRAILKYAPSRFVEPLLGFLSIPILARMLGAADYGDLSIVLLTAGLLRVIFFDWVNNAALRFRSPMADDLSRFTTNHAVGILIGIAVMTPVVVFGKRLFPEKVDVAVGALMGWTILDATLAGFAMSGEMVFRALHRSLAFTLVRAALGVSRHVVGIGALLLTSSLSGYFSARCVAVLVVGVVSWYALRDWRTIRLSSVSRETIKGFALFGLPLVTIQVVNTLINLGNRYVVLGLEGSEQTGLFSAAVNVGSAPMIIFQQIVMLGLYPIAIDYWEKSGDIKRVINDGVRYFLLGGVPALLLLAVLARPVLGVVAGGEYAVAATALRILSLSSFIYGLSQYFTLIFLVSKRTAVMAAIGFAAAILNISVSLLLVGRFGYQAAAAGALAGNVVILAGACRWGVGMGRDTMPVRTFVRVMGAGAVLAGVCWGAMSVVPGAGLWDILVAAPAAFAVYVGILILTGELKKEMQYVKGVFR